MSDLICFDLVNAFDYAQNILFTLGTQFILRMFLSPTTVKFEFGYKLLLFTG